MSSRIGIACNGLAAAVYRTAAARPYVQWKRAKLRAGGIVADLKRPLRRSRSNRMIGGVVGGIAGYFGIDATLARVLHVVGSIVSVAFPGILVYVIMWVIVPEEGAA